MLRQIVSVLLFAGALVAVQPASSHADDASTTFVTMVGNGDYIGGTAARMWRKGVTVSGDPSGMVSVSAGDFTFTFAAAPGQTLTAGTYLRAQRTYLQQDGHPGIDIYGDGRGCNQTSGRFIVKEISPDLSSLWLTYEQHCEGGKKATFGEIRVNVAGGDSELLVAPDAIAWPNQSASIAARNVPVILVNTGAVSVTVSQAKVISGGKAFKVNSNACSVIQIGASCTIQVGFTPPGDEDYVGQLRIVDSTTAGSHTVDLAGTGVLVPPSVKLTTTRRSLGYGAKAKLTLSVKGSYSAGRLTVYSQPVGGARKTIPVFLQRNGSATIRTPQLTRKTTITAIWQGLGTTKKSSVTIAVHAGLSLKMYNASGRRGAYAIYKPSKRMYSIAKVTPVKTGQCLHMSIQAFVGGWRTAATISCAKFSNKGYGGVYLDYRKEFNNVPFRFRASYRGDRANLAATTGWVYAKFVG